MTSEIAVKPNEASLERRNETFAPRTINEALTFAEMLLDSGMVPKSYKDSRPSAIVVALQFGMEVGFQPMQALQCIANINGMPSVWGDGALALIHSSGLLEWIQEDDFDTIKKNKKATCKVKRRGDPIVKEITFSYQDAIDAGIMGNAVWKTYPYRMAMMRARAFALRDKFPDVLKGLKIAEEVQDYTELEGNTPTPAKAAVPGPPPPPTELTPEQKLEKEAEEEAGKEWGTKFYQTYSKSGYLPEESVKEIIRVCGADYIGGFTSNGTKFYSYMVPKKHTGALMKWAETPKSAAQDEPGSHE
jgi:hypothetical protein